MFFKIGKQYINLSQVCSISFRELQCTSRYCMTSVVATVIMPYGKTDLNMTAEDADRLKRLLEGE